MKFVLSPAFQDQREQVRACITDFATTGSVFIAGERNTIKTFDIDGFQLNVKSFKRPNAINRIAYRFFRKSKAERSFEYATKLLSLGIGTPQPVAYAENRTATALEDSYYGSEQMHPKLTYRELVEIPDFPDHENILRQFTRFCFKLHELGIEFKDHSPGNTLILEDAPGTYSFYLVDLNRMAFHKKMSFKQRMHNLRRLTPHEEMVAVMSDEYAKASGKDKTKVFETLWRMTSDFQYKYHRKIRLKKKWLGRK